MSPPIATPLMDKKSPAHVRGFFYLLGRLHSRRFGPGACPGIFLFGGVSAAGEGEGDEIHAGVGEILADEIRLCRMKSAHSGRLWSGTLVPHWIGARPLALPMGLRPQACASEQPPARAALSESLSCHRR